MSSRRDFHRALLAALMLFGLIIAAWAQAAQADAALHWRPAHVVVVIEENKSFSTIIGNPEAPYLNQLAKQGLLFTDAHGIVHPSQPNYVALFAGSTYGLTDDSCPHDLTGPTLASELLAKKLSFAIYSESMPNSGFTGCSADKGLYRRKHNPVADFQAALPASVNLTFSAFPSDYAKLPTVAFVVPNMMNDMHDGTIAEGDRWLKVHLSRYAEWAKSHNSLLVVTWDESDARSMTNQIPLIVVGAGLKPAHSGQFVDHYSLLRTLEDFYVLKPLGHRAKTIPATLLP
ncbi:MAG TPA: alkaline phosphatase family protein [Gammaproteobacteria bacterium]|nr:alkaline phosphatase family protein [Gammaproteobacteria bacterium]